MPREKRRKIAVPGALSALASRGQERKREGEREREGKGTAERVQAGESRLNTKTEGR